MSFTTELVYWMDFMKGLVAMGELHDRIGRLSECREGIGFSGWTSWHFVESQSSLWHLVNCHSRNNLSNLEDFRMPSRLCSDQRLRGFQLGDPGRSDEPAARVHWHWTWGKSVLKVVFNILPVGNFYLKRFPKIVSIEEVRRLENWNVLSIVVDPHWFWTAGSGSRREKMTKNWKKGRNFKFFFIFDCSLLRAGGFSCSLDFLYGVLMKKNYNFW